LVEKISKKQSSSMMLFDKSKE